MATSMESEIERYLSVDPVHAIKAISAELNKNNAKFIKFIESLEPSLTNTDNVIRGRATQLIGDVIEMLPPSFLSKEQGEMVTSFLLAKVSDHHSVQPHALQSLAVLTGKCNSLSDETAKQVCQTIFQEVQNQTLSHGDRRATYRILQNLLGSSKKALQEMGGDFVIGFIQQMDSEKDPRNLLICFNCAQFVSSNIALGPFTEEMFEVLGCYFPIDFVPPPNDSHGITKEDLVMSLRQCFAASMKFAEYCIPLLLEKLSSDLQSARLDSLLTLTECAPVYGLNGLRPFLGSIASIIKREVLMNISADLVTAAKTALTAVYKSVAENRGTNANFTELDESIVELYQDLTKFLDGTDHNKSCLAYSLCRSIAESSPHALTVIVPLVLPSLVVWCQKQLPVLELLDYLKELNGFTGIIHSQGIDAGPLREPLAPLPQLFENLLSSACADIKVEALKGLTLVSSIGMIDELLMNRFFDNLVDKAISERDIEVRNQVLISLHSTIIVNPDMSSQIFSKLIQHTNKGDNNLALDALVHSVIDEKSFIQVNNFLLEMLSANVPESSQNLLNCANSMVDLLKYAKSNLVLTDVSSSTALPLVCMAVKSSLSWTDDHKDTCKALLDHLRNALLVACEKMSKDELTMFWEKLSPFFVEGNIQSLGLMDEPKDINVLQSSSPWQQTQLVALLEGVVTAGEIQAMIESREKVFEMVYVLALNCEDEFTALSACKCVATLFNKAPLGSDIQWFLEPIIEKLKRAMTAEHSLRERLRALQIWLWLTKAAECRGHSTNTLFSFHLVTLLSDPDLGMDVGRKMSMVVQDMDNVFSTRLHSIVTPLYKQRFFALNIKKLMNGYNTASSTDVKTAHLLALSGIVSQLPLQITKPHLPVLFPLLLLAMKDKENPNLSVLLTTLGAAIENTQEAVTSNLDSLIAQLLDLSTNFETMTVRIAALKCLERLTSLPSHVLVPCQNKVVRDLQKAVGDKKRLVRRQAAETRCAWILLKSEQS